MTDKSIPKNWHDYITDQREIAGRIWVRMQERAVTPNQLAEVVGLSVNAVSQWLKGKASDLKTKNLFLVADYLELEVRWLGIGEGPKERANSRAAKHVSAFRGSVRVKASVSGRKAKKRTTG